MSNISGSNPGKQNPKESQPQSAANELWIKSQSTYLPIGYRSVCPPRPNWDSPLPQASVSLPRSQRGDTLPCGRGGGGAPSRTTGKKPSTLSTMCIKSLVFSRLINYDFSQAASFAFPFSTLEAKLCKISDIFIASRMRISWKTQMCVLFGKYYCLLPSAKRWVTSCLILVVMFICRIGKVNWSALGFALEEFGSDYSTVYLFK
jgi:hypothetical protein